MSWKQILVATDFSTRSDRALRRGMLLARDIGARLSLVHVVDDDQPAQIVAAEHAAAAPLLDEHVRTLKEGDGLDCDARIVEGDPFVGISRAATELGADLVVLGPHRRQVLKDVFIGTTAERTVRASPRPVLMANGSPSGAYRHVLVAVDLSDCSADALRALLHLGIAGTATVSVVHVFDVVGTGMLLPGGNSADGLQRYIDEQAAHAAKELDAFLADTGFDPLGRLVRHNVSSTALVIGEAAQELSAGLIVVGTHGRNGLSRLVLGSVAQEVLRTASVDVLAVPPGST